MWQDILKNSSFEKKLKVARDNGTINKNPIKTKILIDGLKELNTSYSALSVVFSRGREKSIGERMTDGTYTTLEQLRHHVTRLREMDNEAIQRGLMNRQKQRKPKGRR